MTVLSWLQMRHDEIYLGNESSFGQQCLRAICITADALRSLTGVKPIQKLHVGFNLHFLVIEQNHATAFELKIQVKLCRV